MVLFVMKNLNFRHMPENLHPWDLSTSTSVLSMETSLASMERSPLSVVSWSSWADCDWASLDLSLGGRPGGRRGVFGSRGLRPRLDGKVDGNNKLLLNNVIE